MDRVLEFAVELAFESGRIQKRRYQERHSIYHKGEINIVTDVDLECQERIIALISKRFPDDHIIAEEQKNVFDGSRNRWIIDPIDGTTNYAHGYPFFCTSVAYEVGGQVVCGVVYNPIFDELFFGEAGKGSYLNGQRLAVSATTEMKQSLLVTGFPYDLDTNKKNNINHFVDFLHHAQAVRRDGSAALNFSYVAAGRFDGFWELNLSSWDMAAGALIVTEAGGLVTGLGGGPFDVYRGQVIASNGLIHGDMVRILKEGGA
ncbi:MAG: inositol monophosphatase family protein [Syntrophorhabdales bacterium]